MASQKRETLGTNVLPNHYELLLDIDYKRLSFKGKEAISAHVKNPTRTIMINCASLKITSASIIANGKSHRAKVFHNAKKETSELSIDRAVSGSIKLLIDYEDEIRENANRGLYKSKYFYKGKPSHILTTQFEPSDARCAFPCFDEPALKATFDLSFMVDKNLTVISNMDVKRESPLGQGRKLVIFNTSPRMSTYLVYFGIGPFETLSSKMGKLTIRVVTTPGKSKGGEMAIGFAKRFLKFYEDYFYIKYPLPKLDLIAIPDFTAGASAMENWGAITFREAELLGSKETISFTMRRRISTVVAHELAHQWFGDLVTMKWWDDLWLNESFATFMEKKTLDTLYPEFKRGIDAITGETAMAFGDDAQRSTHPINVKVNDPSEIGAIFDLISYYKGSAVIAMIEDYAHAETFRMGLHRYIKGHLYSNAQKEDLWRAMRQAGGSAESYLPTLSGFWIDNPGYPMVSVERATGSVKLKQSRFTFLPCKGRQKPWPIPIRYTTEKGEGFILMKGATASIKVPNASHIKLNFRQKGFYRVMYDKESLRALGTAIKAGKIGPIDAYGVISDLSALSRACRIKVTDVMDFIEEYCLGCGYPTNVAISSYFSGLQLRFPHSKKISLRARTLAMKTNRSIMRSVSWVPKKGEDSTITMQRTSAIRNAGIYNDETMMKKCRELFENYISKRSDLHVDIKTPIYMSLAFNGDSRLFSRFISMYKKQDGGEETIRLGAAIGYFNSRSLAAKALEFVMSRYVRTQDKNSVSAFVSATPEGKNVFLKWIKRDWKKIMALYRGDVSGLGRFIEDLDDIDTTAGLEEVKRFFYSKVNYTKDIKRPLETTIEAIKTNIRFVEYNS